MPARAIPPNPADRAHGARTQPRPVVLDAYAARSCPVKTQNRYDDNVLKPIRTDESLQEVFAGGKLFEDQVLDQIMASGCGAVDLRPLEILPWAHREAATAQAVSEGMPVIVFPSLPVDQVGHRCGRPDLLVRGPNRPDGRPGYLPVEAKRHKLLERRSGAPAHLISDLEHPLWSQSRNLISARLRGLREPDLLQMAHYWRQLEALGWSAGGDPTVGVVGTDRLSDVVESVRGPVPADDADELVITWISLTAKLIRTFSRTSAEGWKDRAALERYDHEHAFRVKVANVAQRRQGAADDPAPMVSPIVVRGCSHCEWWETCRASMPPNDISLRIEKSRLDVREITVLRSLGIHTVNDLARTDLNELLPRYLPEVTHRPGAAERLELATRRAILINNNVELERFDQTRFDLGEPAVEIDFDIETSAADRIYLWGFWVREVAAGAAPYYKAFARFEDLDSAGEIRLAGEAMSWLAEVLESNPSTLVYHYSDYECVHIRKMAEVSGDAAIQRVADAIGERFVDLFVIVKKHFFGAHGLGLKVVAQADAGFAWRDDDPGGLNSQRWFAEAVHDEDEQIRLESADRVLAYNEDDVRATAALREWLRSLDK